MYDFRGAFGALVIDGPACEVRLGGTIVSLTKTEFEILLVLASQPRRVITEEEIIRAVWGDGWFGDENNLAVHVSKMRHKLGESGLCPRYIRTVRGVGYRFDPDPPDDVRDATTTHERPREQMRTHASSVEVRTDKQLRVTAVEPLGARVLGHDPSDLLGRYLPLIDGYPWHDRASALEAIEVLIASGVREWTAPHVVRHADGTRGHADVATRIDVDAEGRPVELRFVLVESNTHAATTATGGENGSVSQG